MFPRKLLARDARDVLDILRNKRPLMPENSKRLEFDIKALRAVGPERLYDFSQRYYGFLCENRKRLRSKHIPVIESLPDLTLVRGEEFRLVEVKALGDKMFESQFNAIKNTLIPCGLKIEVVSVVPKS